MNKFVLGASAALAAVVIAPTANATVVDPIILTGLTTDAFTGEVAAAGAFTDTFAFTLATPSALTSASVISSLTAIGGAGDIDFTKVSFDGIVLFDIDNNLAGFVDLATIMGVSLTAGAHTLVIEGTAFAAASYGGNINITQTVGDIPLVPEPSTWAMMVAGIATVGFALRRRAQTVRVAFS